MNMELKMKINNLIVRDDDMYHVPDILLLRKRDMMIDYLRSYLISVSHF